MSDTFSVYYTSNESLGSITECEVSHADADKAKQWFIHHTNNVCAKMGFTVRVIMTNALDEIVAEWRYGHGITWPREDTCN